MSDTIINAPLSIQNTPVVIDAPITYGFRGERGVKGDDGRTSYQLYLDTTTDDPVKTLEDWLEYHQGPMGEKGEPGIPGDPGLKGDKGDKGDTGADGAQGLKGDKGDTGADGAQGLKGDKGDTGDQGLKGDKGDKGDPGEGGAAAPELRQAYVPGISYCGMAPTGSATSESVWTITRITIADHGTVTTANASSVAWDDYLTATYT